MIAILTQKHYTVIKIMTKVHKSACEHAEFKPWVTGTHNTSTQPLAWQCPTTPPERFYMGRGGVVGGVLGEQWKENATYRYWKLVSYIIVEYGLYFKSWRV